MKAEAKIAQGFALWGRLVAAVVALAAGGAIYVVFRSRSLIFFRWLDKMGLGEWADGLRALAGSARIENDFFLYTLPDMLWLTSYILVANALISKRDTLKYIFWTLIVPSLAVVNELLQKFHIAAGTYDVADLTAYLSVIGVNLLIFICWRRRSK